MRRLFFIAIALCGFANAKADEVPKFSQFPAREYSRGPTGRLDLSDPHAYSYRTRLREGAQQGANFAGHYTVMTWGCGTDCATGAIIDALTGHVVFLPSVDSNQMEHERDPDFNAIVFRLDSRLIVFAGQLNDQGERATFFMDFEGKNFRQVYRVIDRGAAEEPQAVKPPTNPGNTPTVRTPVREQPATVPPTAPVASSGTARRDDGTTAARNAPAPARVVDGVEELPMEQDTGSGLGWALVIMAIAAIGVGWMAQSWKQRTGAAWCFFALLFMFSIYFVLFHITYAPDTFNKDEGWAALGITTALIGVGLLTVVIATLPRKRSM